MLAILARSSRMFAVRGIVAVLLGVAALASTNIALDVLVMLFGAFALVDGAVAIASAMAHRAGPYRRWVLIEGLTAFGVGTITLVWPTLTRFVVLYLIAAWAIITGILEILAAIEFRKVIEGRKGEGE